MPRSSGPTGIGPGDRIELVIERIGPEGEEHVVCQSDTTQRKFGAIEAGCVVAG